MARLKNLGAQTAPQAWVQLLEAYLRGKNGHVAATLILLYGERPATEGNIVELRAPLIVRTSRSLRRGIVRGVGGHGK